MFLCRSSCFSPLVFPQHFLLSHHEADAYLFLGCRKSGMLTTRDSYPSWSPCRLRSNKATHPLQTPPACTSNHSPANFPGPPARCPSIPRMSTSRPSWSPLLLPCAPPLPLHRYRRRRLRISASLTQMQARGHIQAKSLCRPAPPRLPPLRRVHRARVLQPSPTPALLAAPAVGPWP